ncbi:MAG TPA: hypothetical protein PLX23_03940 [Candidatus Hydrogenedens sp.]|nr:hypothetical protein [Candidatus Hydrogenedens sp.]
MKHVKPISGTVKDLDWGLDSGTSGIIILIQAVVSLLNAIGLLKGTTESTNNTGDTTNETTE